MVDEKDEKRISLRISPALFEQISAATKARNMSVNAFIITALEEAVSSDSLARRLEAVEKKLAAVESRLIS